MPKDLAYDNNLSEDPKKSIKSGFLWLGIASILVCTLNFGLGKWVGHQYGDTIAGGQLMGQKNTAFGIWMATTYLNPLASVFLAFYSVWQNLFNSWQIWRYERKLAGNNTPATT